ncbi:hypothetical protein CMV_027093, partial [Castanea mollissima]
EPISIFIILFEVLANLLGAWRVRFLWLQGQCSFTLDDAFFPATHGGKSPNSIREVNARCDS